MDPICHTLVGAALASTGLGNKVRFGTTTLIVAANLPDVDALAYFGREVAGYELRRGITHGLPAVVVLPFLLALLVFAICRWRRPLDDDPGRTFRWLLLLAAAGIASHPLLDWLNNYGMRWLMPFVDRWFYGDALFIIDPVMWVLLLGGVVAARLARDGGPAVIALCAVLAYIGMNLAITRHAERLTRAAGEPILRFMASPAPLTPFRREIVMEYDGAYGFATYELFGDPQFRIGDRRIARGSDEAFAAAARDPDASAFLHWARFPYAVTDAGTEIRLADARYVRDVDQSRLDGFGVYAFSPRGPSD